VDLSERSIQELTSERKNRLQSDFRFERHLRLSKPDREIQLLRGFGDILPKHSLAFSPDISETDCPYRHLRRISIIFVGFPSNSCSRLWRTRAIGFLSGMQSGNIFSRLSHFACMRQCWDRDGREARHRSRTPNQNSGAGRSAACEYE
jgi:hypothetical protein